MKRITSLLLILCILLSGCTDSKEMSDIPNTSDNTTPTESTLILSPLPDTTMASLSDATVAVSLEEGNAYVDDTGKMQMDLTIYAYDQYDMVDIARLKIGDIIACHSGDIIVTSMEQNEAGTIFINGGLDNGGFDLVTDDNGVFYEVGFNDHKNWYEVGKTTIRVSADFVFTDSSDLDQGELIFYPGSFLIGEVTNYDFSPYNTTIRIENSQIVEMNRRYIP